MAILTIGFNPAIDRILECPEFHIGGHQKVKQVARLAAGKAANVNRALAQLGADSLATGFLGKEDAPFFHEQLAAAGPGRIACRFVEVAGQTRENISILDPARRQETHLRDRGFRVTDADAAALERAIVESLKPGDFALFSGSLCQGIENAYFLGLLARCREAGAKLAVDSSGSSLKAAVAEPLWLLKPNLVELRQLLGVEVPNAASAVRDAAMPLLARVENVLVTRGPMGAVLLTQAGVYSARLTTRDLPVRTVGCGDHLLAGFVAEIAAGRPPEEALRTAMAVATARALSTKLDIFDLGVLATAREQIVIERM
jgi:1-phosphofructokinase family hexose kinase